MSWRREFSRLGALVRRPRPLDDLEKEIRAHIAMEERENLEAGMPPEEAHDAALRRFGNVTLAQERSRDMWVWNSTETLFQDLRYGLRQLRRSPGFAAVAVITLALGIGANTAIFSLIDAVMLRSIPVPDPSQLVVFRWKARHTPRFDGYGTYGDCPDGGGAGPGLSGCSFPTPVFDAMRSEARLFSAITAFAGPANLELSGNGTPSMASGEAVSGDYFSTLGVSAAIGRTLGPEDDSPSASPVVLLDYAYWQSAFGGDRSVLGRRIDLNNVPFTIVGVTAASFTRLSPGKTQDLWFPMAMGPRLDIPWTEDKDLSNWCLVILGRLKPDSSLSQAQAAASLLFRNEMLHGAKPLSKPQDDPAITLVPAQKGLTGWRSMFSTPLYVLMAAVGLILLIACANVAGLLLARATTRYKETAVRLAMGAARTRILRQLLTESVMLSVAGGTLGIAFAYWGVHVIMELISGSTSEPLSFAVAPDWRILAFTVSIALLTGILFGLAPALRSTQVDLTPALKENTSTAARGGSGMRRGFHFGNMLVIAQVGLSVVVLAGAGLLVRTLRNLRAINPGFDTQNMLLFGIDPTLSGYKDIQIQTLYRNLQARLAALPGVISASYSSDALLTGSLGQTRVHVEGQSEKKSVQVDTLATGPGFFRTLHIPLLEGRNFTSEDFEQAAEASAASKAAEQAGGATVQPGANASASVLPPIPLLVNQAFIRSYFPRQNPLGKQINQSRGDDTSATPAANKPKSPGWQIVGVVGDTKYNNPRRGIHPAIFLPLTGGGAHFELRTAGSPALLIRTVRKAANQVDSHLPLFDIHTQSQKINELLLQERLVARFASFFGVLAILLACMGLYGLLSYEVTRHTREVGIRMALGAQKGEVLKLVVKRGVVLAVAGVAVGIAGALGLTRFLSSLLYGVKPADPLTFVLVSLLLTGVALLACYIPARRAAKVDPMVALRYE